MSIHLLPLIFDRFIVCYATTICTTSYLQVTSLACLLTVLTAGTAKMGLFSLPHFPRLRIMMFITLFTVIFTVFILFLNISHLHTFMPVDYGKMVSFISFSTKHLSQSVQSSYLQQTVAYLLLTVSYAVASSLVFQSYFDDSIIPSIPNWTKTQTLIVAVSIFQNYIPFQESIGDYISTQLILLSFYCSLDCILISV